MAMAKGQRFKRGENMFRNIVIMAADVAAFAYGAARTPAQVGSCAIVSAKAFGLQATAGGGSGKKLNRRITHWAHKSKLQAVRVDRPPRAARKARRSFPAPARRRFVPETDGS
jgi:hypothetical protein